MSQIISKNDLDNYMSPAVLDPVIGQKVVDGINDWIENRTNRCWGEAKSITERYDWGKTLWLHKQDVQSITTIKAGWPGQTQTTLDPAGYFTNSYGRVTMFWNASLQPNSSSLYNDLLEITYVYGVTAVPDDLIMAALGIAAGFYNFAVNGQRDVVASSVGSYRLEYAGAIRSAAGAPDPAKSTQDANWVIIDTYKQRRQ